MYRPHMSTKGLRRISQCGSLKKMLPTPDVFTVVVAKLNTAVLVINKYSDFICCVKISVTWAIFQ